jgi:hypothetical protein
MGADLYIESLFKANNKRYSARFEEAVRRRDRAKTENAKDAHQQKVDEYYGRMYEVGYYRDSYNDSNLFWKLGLDYWVWFAGFLDKERLLHPDKAELALGEIESRKHLLDEIEPDEEQQYFREKYDDLTAFLRTAIEMDEPVQCSI